MSSVYSLCRPCVILRHSHCTSSYFISYRFLHVDSTLTFIGFLATKRTWQAAADKDDEFSEWTRDLAPKQRGSWYRKREALGKVRFGKLGLNFNTDFQKLHRHSLKKHHWRNCLIYLSLGREPNPGCDDCKQLMERSSVSLEEVAIQVPDDGQSLKQTRLAKPARPGVAKGRPKKGQQSEFCVWKWLEEHRLGMYERIDVEGNVPHVKCNACKSKVKLSRTSTNYFIKQHEESDKHKKSLSEADGTLSECKGMLAQKACQELDALKGYEQAFQVWASAGFPWHNHGCGSVANRTHACYLDDNKEVRLRCDGCEKEKYNVQPKADWCVHCQKFATSTSFLQRVSRWVFRMLLVDLLQATFVDNMPGREKILEQFRTLPFLHPDATAWEEVQDADELEKLPYTALYELCRQKLGSIPKTICNTSAWTFIESRFSWLSSRKATIASSSQSSTLQSFATALANGSLPSEMNLARHILDGKLRADAVLKTLVTALVSKCAHQGNRKRKTSNCLPGVDQAELAETGFALATCSLDLLGSPGYSFHMFSIVFISVHLSQFNSVYFSFFNSNL